MPVLSNRVGADSTPGDDMMDTPLCPSVQSSTACPCPVRGPHCEGPRAPPVTGAQGKRSTLTFGKAEAFLPAGVWHDLASQSNNSPLPVWWSETPKSVEEEKFSSRSLHICKMVS